ncbi:MAG: hypothetical protein NC924_03615 [Candidatus Omnitrophica bacterium]|nr:hypothetical protein [Candidatus Omnitrophota bacterium]
MDNVTAQIEMLVKEVVPADMEIVELYVQALGGNKEVRLLLYREDGIGLDEYARLNRRLSDAIEERRLLSPSFSVEVSSPGLDRPLRAWRDFARAAGKRITVWLNTSRQSRGELTGVLETATELGIVLRVDSGETVDVRMEDINKGRLELRW